VAEVHNRIMDNLRVKLPGAVDGAIQLEIFNTIDDLCRNALYTSPPTDQSTALTTWLTEAEYKQHYRLIIDGTLARMLSQGAKPYSNIDLAKIHAALYASAMDQARTDKASEDSETSITGVLMDTLRVSLPGAKDGTIQLFMGNVIDEMCRERHIYRTTLPLTLTAGEVSYTLAVEGFTIVSLHAIAHETFGTLDALYDSSTNTIEFGDEPSAEHAEEPVYIEVSLTPNIATEAMEDWLPAYLWKENYQAITDGTLARMMLTLSKPYSNPQLALYHGKRYRKWMNIGGSEAALGDTPGGQRWAFPRFM
jgi:hypothetical protein